MIAPPARVLVTGVAVGAVVWAGLALLALPSPSLFGGLAAGAVLAFG